MRTRQQLMERPDVPNADIERIIEVASRLQDEDRQRNQRPTIDDMERVAQELDIDPRYVEEAIGVIRDTEQAESAQAQERTQRLRAAVLIGAAGAVTLLVIAGAFLFSGANTLANLDALLRQAEEAIQVVVERQATLAPQLVALAGSKVDLSVELQAVKDAPDVEASLAAIDTLNARMTIALADLADTAPESTRLNLQHELAGGINRIAVERRRYSELQLRTESATRRPDTRLARLFGF